MSEELTSKAEGQSDSAQDAAARRSAMFEPESLQRLLTDCITYKSTIHDIDVVLKCGGKINEPVKRGLRPLHYAVYVDYVDCVKYLIENGANVNAPDDIGYAPIHLCARKGNFESMKILIENGSLVDFFTNDPDIEENMRSLGYLTIEPLNLAIENNHVDCVRLLLEKGAKPDHKYFMGYEVNLVPLEHFECLELLLQYGADPNVFNRCGISPLMKACRQHNMQAVKMLIKYGALVDLQCPPRFDQKTAIHFAIQKGNLGIAHTLLRHGANTSRLEDYKYAALHAAVIADRPDLCALLLRWKAKVDEETDEKTTPLMLACATPNLNMQKEIIEVLLKNGANPNAHSDIISYTSPYMSPLAEYLRNIPEKVSYEITLLLIRYGARVNFRGSTSVTRLKDPFGVLHYLPKVNINDKSEIFNLLATAGAVFDVDAIRRYSGLTERERSILVELGTKPLTVRQLVRLYLRDLLLPSLPEMVNTLPVPAIVRSYLLFDA